MTRVTRQVGGPREGGYKFTAKAPCLEDAAELTDLQVMERFIAHQQRRCPC